MPRLTATEMATIARALRGLAARTAEDAKCISDQDTRALMERAAQAEADLAERFERARRKELER